MIKVLETSGIYGMYLNIIKAIYSKLAANIKLNREKLKVITLKPGQDYPLSPYLINIVFEVRARVVRQQKDEGDTNWKGRSQTFAISR